MRDPWTNVANTPHADKYKLKLTEPFLLFLWEIYMYVCVCTNLCHSGKVFSDLCFCFFRVVESGNPWPRQWSLGWSLWPLRIILNCVKQEDEQRNPNSWSTATYYMYDTSDSTLCCASATSCMHATQPWQFFLRKLSFFTIIYAYNGCTSRQPSPLQKHTFRFVSIPLLRVWNQWLLWYK